MRFPTRSLALTVSLACAAMAQAADIKLGVAEALSGGAAQYGLAIRNGFQLAADEINAKGGVNGDKIQLVIEGIMGNSASGRLPHLAGGNRRNGRGRNDQGSARTFWQGR